MQNTSINFTYSDNSSPWSYSPVHTYTWVRWYCFLSREHKGGYNSRHCIHWSRSGLDTLKRKSHGYVGLERWLQFKALHTVVTFWFGYIEKKKSRLRRFGEVATIQGTAYIGHVLIWTNWKEESSGYEGCPRKSCTLLIILLIVAGLTK